MVSEIKGEPVTREAVAVDLSRAGLTNRVRYDDLIPWKVAPEHQKAYDLWMLRTLARRRRGLPLAGGMERRLDNWLARLAAWHIVIHYDATAGMQWARRRPWDTAGGRWCSAA